MAWEDLGREGQPVLATLRLATVVHTDTQGESGKKMCDFDLLTSLPLSLPLSPSLSPSLSLSLSLSVSLRHAGYDMNAYANMYGQGGGMGSYSQTASSYGPNRGYAGGGGGGGAGDAGRGDKDGRGGAPKYHPYRRY